MKAFVLMIVEYVSVATFAKEKSSDLRLTHLCIYYLEPHIDAKTMEIHYTDIMRYYDNLLKAMRDSS